MRLLSPAPGLLILGTVAASTLAAQAERFDLEKTKTTLTGLIERARAERGIPSISIALVRGDSVVWKAAFGWANVRMKTPATTETLYSTGSTFKSATATGIMQLAEQGKLQLDHPVNRYLGEARVQDRLQSEKPVTIRHILSHWSGLTSGAVTKPVWGRELPKSLAQVTSELYSVRAPETTWEYNNWGYGMAGLLIERISGQPYEQYLVEHVLRPLGITVPHPVNPSPDMVERMALPYLPGGRGGQPRPVEQVRFDVYPAGDIYLTPTDMARYLGAHLNGGAFNGGRILSEASVKQMHEPQFGGTYGLGFRVLTDSATGHTMISHGGGVSGQNSFLLGDLDAKVGVYFMSNSGAHTEIADAAIKLLRGEAYVPPVQRRSIAVDPAILDRYVGIYELSPQLVLGVRRLGAGLVLRWNDSDEASLELQAETPTRFYITLSPERTLTFVTNASGAVTHLVMGGGAEEQIARRRP
jgi:CubicO group peptidase (beta-lactamase class C family)